MLSETHSHERDHRIRFVEDGHLYFVDGREGYTSVTTFVHTFFSPFDARQVILKMRASPRWGASPYHGMTDEEIMSTWEKKRDSSASSGTFMHQQIEAFFNHQPYDTTPIPVEWQHFLRFHHGFGLVPYRTEWFVFDEETEIAGSIDMTYKLVPENDVDLVIVDWKRTADLKLENKYQKGLYPLHSLDDCNYIHYCLQLNTYKYILEKKYGKKIQAMYLVVLHPSNDTFQQKEVPDMQKDVLRMLDDKKNPKTSRLSFLRR